MRALDRQLEIAQKTASNFNETARIFDLRFKAGVVAKTEVMQVNSQAQQALAAIPAFEQAIAAQENLISLLLGRNPGPIPRGKTIDQLVAPLIPADLPSVLLQRRPDILQAEQNLVAANANVGATKALYYPNISITGALGSVSTALGDLLTDPATTMLLGAGVTGPIFTFGGIKGQVDAAEAGSRQAELVYRQTVLNAFRETNDALTGSQKKVQEVAMQQQRVASLREFARLSTLRFDKGVAGYLDVLVAENELFAADLASVRLQADRYAQVVAVYQAMGGGWVDIASSISPQAAELRHPWPMTDPDSRPGHRPEGLAAATSRPAGPRHQVPVPGPRPDVGQPGDLLLDPALACTADRPRHRLRGVRHLGVVDLAPATHAVGLCRAVPRRSRGMEFHPTLARP